MSEAQILHVDLAGAAARAHMRGSGLRQAPGPSEYLDLLFEAFDGGFALEIAELQKCINRHVLLRFLLVSQNSVDPATRRLSRSAAWIRDATRSPALPTGSAASARRQKCNNPGCPPRPERSLGHPRAASSL